MPESPTFWVAIAFVIFVALAAKPIASALFGALDARAARIRTEIEQAQAFREEAQKTLAEYKRKQRDAAREAEGILAHARVEMERLCDQAERDLEMALERREQAALEKIAQAETQAIQEVRDQAIDVALLATAKLISENLDKKRADQMVDRAISLLSGKLH